MMGTFHGDVSRMPQTMEIPPLSEDTEVPREAFTWSDGLVLHEEPLPRGWPWTYSHAQRTRFTFVCVMRLSLEDEHLPW